MPRGPHFAQIRQVVWHTSQLSISHRFGSVPHRRDVNEKRQNGGSGGIISGSCGRTDHAVELRKYGASESPPEIPPPSRGVPEIRNRKGCTCPRQATYMKSGIRPSMTFSPIIGHVISPTRSLPNTVGGSPPNM